MAQWLTRATEERNVAGSTPHGGTDFCIPLIPPSTRMSEYNYNLPLSKEENGGLVFKGK
jgi:hypothetical protein